MVEVVFEEGLGGGRGEVVSGEGGDGGLFGVFGGGDYGLVGGFVAISAKLQ